MGLFKSKAEKELEARLAIRQTINDLKKSERKLEKKKEDMIRHASEAKSKGLTQQYNAAVSGLKMVMSYQKRCSAMILQIEMTESMRDLATLSAKFVKQLGNVGREVTKVTASANFAGNQLAFEKGMLAAETAMEQLEGFMEDAGSTYEGATDDEVNAEIDALIDATSAAQVDALDEEIERRLAQSEAKRAGIKE